MAEEGLMQREAQVLEEIIQYYLKHHEAVSARTLSKVSRLSLSPTTIRNLMEDLSAEGLLTSEGVPRGRIPTQKAFTIYVTRLGGRAHGVRSAGAEERLESLESQPTLAQGLAQVGGSLAGSTGCVALAGLPPRDRYPLHWARLSAVPGRQVLVTLRTCFGDLWSKLIAAAAPVDDGLLAQVALYINGNYRGQPLDRIRRDIMAGEPKGALETMPSLGAAFRLLRRAFEWEERGERALWGQDNMLRWPEARDPQRLLLFNRALADPELLANVRAAARAVNGGWVSIGTETGYRGLEDCSVAGHDFGLGDWRGHIGVLGPMGMNYGHVLYRVAQSAAALGEFMARLNGQSLRPDA
jgi:heat-inducible transcriptional repressor